MKFKQQLLGASLLIGCVLSCNVFASELGICRQGKSLNGYFYACDCKPVSHEENSYTFELYIGSCNQGTHVGSYQTGDHPAEWFAEQRCKYFSNNGQWSQGSGGCS